MKKRKVSPQATLDELDPPAWGEPAFDSSLVHRCHRLRGKPVADFTIEDLRLMIGQKIGLKTLIPIALDRLETNPLSEGNCYPGDLLSMVLSAGAEFWKREWEFRNRLDSLLDQVANVPKLVEQHLREYQNYDL